MQLKDVERLTGLSSKAIRLYEEKGLLVVERGRYNAYRQYTEENVERLLQIKVLRYLDFSLAEIKEVLELAPQEWQAVLAQKRQQLRDQRDQMSDKERLLSEVMATKNQPDWGKSLHAQVDFFTSEDFQILKTELLPNLWGIIAYTLVLIGPILWFFVKISQGQLEDLSWLAPISLLNTVLVTLQWRTYLVAWWRHRDKVQQKNRQGIKVVLVAIVSLVLLLASFLGVDQVIAWFFLPEGWLFYEVNHLAGQCFILAMMALILSCGLRLVGRWSVPKPFLLGLALLVVATMMSLIESITVVTKEEIVAVSVLGKDKVYQYAQVEEVKAGFGTKRISLSAKERRGEFFYQISLDGRWVVFMTPSVNDQLVAGDTYRELEEFDQTLMGLGVAKTSSSQGSQYSDVDSDYLQRFLRIVERQPIQID